MLNALHKLNHGKIRANIALCSLAATLAALLTVPNALAGSPEPQIERFQTADGAYLVGDLYAKGQKRLPTVVMWHMLGRSRQVFLSLAPALSAAGFVVLNMDLRGHGQSVTTVAGGKLDYQTFKEQDWLKLPADATTIIQDVPRLSGCDANKIALIGSSIGANTAALVGSDPHVKALVLLSPGDDYHGLKPIGALRQLRKPVLIIAARGDSYSAESIKNWGNLGPQVKIVLVDGAAHGNVLLSTKPELNQTITSFIQAALR